MAFMHSITVIYYERKTVMFCAVTIPLSFQAPCKNNIFFSVSHLLNNTSSIYIPKCVIAMTGKKATDKLFLIN